MPDNTNLPGIAIIIDAWPDYQAETVSAIRDFCQHNDSIKAVALASFSLSPNRVTQRICETDEPWYSNTKKLFKNTSKIPRLENWWHGLYRDTASTTDARITGMPLREDQVGFFLLDPLQLIYYCNCVDPSIKNFWFFGGAWEVCVKTRPVGWYQLAAFQKNKFFVTEKNFYTRLSCVTGENRKVRLKIDDPWMPVVDDIFQLDHNRIVWDFQPF